MPTLADIYSAADSFKRRLSDAASNPSGALSQMLGYANDRARNFNELSRQAADEAIASRNPFANGPANQALDQAYVESIQPVGMTVWHGSPYKFNAFDASKIGSGEGAQAYGHGLYVAENPAIAKEYQKNVKDMDSIAALNNQLSKLSKAMDEDSVYPGAYRKFKSEKGQKAADEYDRLMEIRNQKSTDPGNLYKIDLPDEHIENMLDWDKPLSQQSQAVNNALQLVERNRLKDLAKRKISARSDLIKSGKDTSIIDNQIEQLMEEINAKDIPFGGTGESYYKSLRNKFGNQEEASKYLKDMGITGIKYFDQGSRGAGKGSRNFVVFPGNEHLLNITDINGKPIK